MAATDEPQQPPEAKLPSLKTTDAEALDAAVASSAPAPPLQVSITKLLWKLRAENGWRYRDYHKYSHFLKRYIRRLRAANGLGARNNAKGAKQTMPPQPLGNTPAQLELLALTAELSYARMLHQQEEVAKMASEPGGSSAQKRDDEQKRRKRMIRRKAQLAGRGAIFLMQAAEKFADKSTLIECQCYGQFILGVQCNVNENYGEAADNLQAALHHYNQVRVLLATDQDGTAAVGDAISLTEKELRQAAFHAAARGIVVSTARTDVSSAATGEKEMRVFSWKGADVDVPVALLQATNLHEAFAEPLLPALLERMEANYSLKRDEIEKQLIECHGQADAVFRSLEGLRGFLLQEETVTASDALLATESHLRELARVINIEGGALILALYFHAPEEIPDGIAVQVADAVKQQLESIANASSPPGCSPRLRGQVALFNAFLKEHLQPFIALAQACRQVAVVRHLVNGQPAKAYALARVTAEMFESLMDEDWSFPDSAMWEGSPLHRVAQAARMLILAHANGRVAYLRDQAAAAVIRESLGHVPSPTGEKAVMQLAKKAESLLTADALTKLQFVPMKPVVYDVARLYLQGEIQCDGTAKQQVYDMDDDDLEYHDFDEDMSSGGEVSVDEGEGALDVQQEPQSSGFLNFASSWLRRN